MTDNFKHPLSGAWLKANRAGQQLQALSLHIEEFVKGDFYKLFRQVDPDAKIVYDVIRFNKDFPLEWPVAIGEIAHNLRCSLDYLVYQLSILDNGKAPTSNKVQFPIFDTEAGYNSKNGDMLVGLKDATKAFIRGEQPFLRDKPSFCALWHLHKINNWDKHRTITVAAARSISISSSATVGAEGRTGAVVFPPSIVKNNTPLFGAMVPDGPEPIMERAAKVEVEGKATMEIAFEEPVTEYGIPVVALLNEIGKSVFDVMHRANAKFFP